MGLLVLASSTGVVYIGGGPVAPPVFPRPSSLVASSRLPSSTMSVIFHRIANTLVYFLFLGSHLYSFLGPAKGTDFYGLHPTYITPASWAFAIWGLIHFLFGGFAIWQWLPGTEEIVHHGVAGWFILAALLSNFWLGYWQAGHLVLALFVLILASGSVSILYYQLTNLYPAETLIQSVFVHAPVSLWHGWLVFVFWINLLAVFVPANVDADPSWIQVAVSVFVLIELIATAVGYTEYKSKYGDVAGAFVITWTLAAIAANQHNGWIHYTAIVGVIVVVLYALGRPVRARRESSEYQPILG
ncbi:uncharacterized protein BJ171DRAFT_490256 [Polychytrium aggregatum]|uniref:uncharacterized protein n=1 Tax=Polychytrium aggregatum TaxID=110093 RepID=UPI0022FE1C99|nr:uncharacterized protein BJ171DRAFT_490256 [Polychytrium aggregatum]KAI9208109.1 hypothetical protein BJ171DRAFT_490256 [Polychytrium aggregatum]